MSCRSRAHRVLDIPDALGIYFYAAVFAIGGTTLLAARVAAAVVNAGATGLVFALARLERDYDVVAQLPAYRVYRRHDMAAPDGQPSAVGVE